MGNYTSLRRQTTVQVNHRETDEDSGGSVLYRSIDEVTPVYFAIRNGKLRDVERCITDHQQDVNKPIPGMLVTPMSVAAQSSTSVLTLLIDSYNGDVNGRDGNGSTPLIVASRAGNVNAVRLLLEHSGDVGVKSEVEDIPRVIKRELEAMDSMEMIADILRCVSQGQPSDAMEYRGRFLNDLLRHAADENIQAHELLEPYLCNTALIQATREHHVDVLHELLHSGANVHETNSAGNTALHIASGSLTADPHRLIKSSTIPSTLFIGPCVAAVEMLIQHGAKVRLINNQGETPLQRTVRIGQLDHPLCYHEWQLHTSDVRNICDNALQCIELLLKAGSTVPRDSTFIPSLWTIAENLLDSDQSCQNTYRFISVIKMIKLSCPNMNSADLQLDDLTNYPELSEIRKFVLNYTSSPLKLQDLCRIVIRRKLKDSPFLHCKELPVPQRVKDFLTFEII